MNRFRSSECSKKVAPTQSKKFTEKNSNLKKCPGAYSSPTDSWLSKSQSPSKLPLAFNARGFFIYIQPLTSINSKLQTFVDSLLKTKYYMKSTNRIGGSK